MVAAAPRRVKGTSLLFDVFVLAQAVGEMLGDALADGPLTPEEYAVYSHLLETGPSTPTQVARELRVPATTVSDWVRTMTARRHVRRRRSRTDGRSYELVVTAAGVRAHRETHRLFEDVNARFLARLARPEGELRQVLAEVLAATGTPAAVTTGAAGAAVVGDDPPAG